MARTGWKRSPSAKLCEIWIAALLVTIGQIRSFVALSSKLCPRIRGLLTITHLPVHAASNVGFCQQHVRSSSVQSTCST
jgi:hypothetical protein